MNKVYGLFILATLCWQCSPSEPIEVKSDQFFSNMDQVTEVMIHDIFSPPVASRIYVYPNIAAHEVLAQNGKLKSLKGAIDHLPEFPKADDKVHIELAALMAHLEVSQSLVFSQDLMQAYKDSIYAEFESQNKATYTASLDYALSVAEMVKEWYAGDHYNETRTLPKFSIDTNDPSRWQPTPPAYMAGIEPHWRDIRPMLLDSAAQFKPKKHPEFSLEQGSAFRQELNEVYAVGKELEKKGDNSEEVKIAQFWDCNPYVSVNKGHLMFATKKITPGAHWMGIAKIASQKSKQNFAETVHALTLTSIAIFDAFISCWDEKYRSNLIRPETLINQHIDEEWKPILQTPPFPEYTSGHSVVSGSASTMLTALFGDNFSFDDTTEIPYGLPVRSFTSFDQAAEEAAISRLYGGIHYRAACEEGLVQGRNVGSYIVNQSK